MPLLLARVHALHHARVARDFPEAISLVMPSGHGPNASAAAKDRTLANILAVARVLGAPPHWPAGCVKESVLQGWRDHADEELWAAAVERFESDMRLFTTCPSGQSAAGAMPPSATPPSATPLHSAPPPAPAETLPLPSSSRIGERHLSQSFGRVTCQPRATQQHCVVSPNLVAERLPARAIVHHLVAPSTREAELEGYRIGRT